MADTIKAGRDVSVYRTSPITNFGDEEFFWVKKVGIDHARAFLWFDVPPKPGYSVSNATLELYVHEVDNPLTRDLLYVEAHRVAESWAEDTASWNEQADVEDAYLDRLDVTAVGWKIWSVTAAVQAWHNGTEANYGIRLSVEPGAGDGPRWRARSSEYTTDATLQPKLVVTYVAKAPNTPTLDAHPNYDATQASNYSWDFEHDDPNTVQESYQLQIMRVSDSVVVHDTLQVTSAAESLTLAANTLANGVDYQWRVKTWGPGNTEGPWSTYDAFSTQSAPTAAVTAPATDGATVTTSSYNIQWSFTHATETQSAFQVQLYNTGDGSLVSDSGKVASTDTQHLVTSLEDGASLRAEVTVWNISDVASAEALRTFTVDTIPPPTPTVTVTNDSVNGRLSVSIDNGTPSGTGESTPDHNDLYRRKSGDVTWDLIAENLAVDATYQDYGVPSGTTFEYRVRAWSTVDTYADGTGSAALSLMGVWLHDPADAAGTSKHFLYDGLRRTEDWSPVVELFRFAGRPRVVAQFGEMPREELLSVVIQTPDSSTRDEVIALAQRKKILLYRDGRGRKYYVVVNSFSLTDDNAGGTVRLSLSVVDYSD